MKYECSTCGTNNPNLFVRCYRPDCPDGHDQGRFDSPHPNPSYRPPRNWRGIAARFLFVIALFAMFFAGIYIARHWG